MATVPTPWTMGANGVVPSTSFNAGVRDPLRLLLSPPLAVMRQTVAQSIPNVAFTPITFDVHDIDRDNGHSTVSNTSRYTCQTPGWYGAESNIQFAANSAGRRLSHWNVNGTTLPTGDSTIMTISSGGGNSGLINVRRMFLNVGDYVEIAAFQDSGGALNILSSSYFSMLWIST